MKFTDDFICFLWIQLGGPRDGADGKFFRIKISLLYVPIGCAHGFSMFRFGSSSGGAPSAGSVL